MMINGFEIEVIKSRRRSLSLQISIDGKITARAPIDMDKRDIEDFVAKKSAWIEENLTKINRNLQNTIKLTDDEIKTLYKEAKVVIPQRVEHYSKIVGVSYGRITIRKQKSKWGSCSAQGNLNFNCLLMLTPIEVIDSIVVHELCHIKHMNHSHDFYAEVIKAYPEYKKWNEWLKDNGSVIMMRAQ